MTRREDRVGSDRPASPTRDPARGEVRKPDRVEGFTLIELLLVVVIIGILAALIVPRLAGRSQEARNAAAKEEIARLGTCLDLFENDTGRYPTADEGLTALVECPAGLPDPAKWKGPYLKKLPVDPWNRPYKYVYPGSGGPKTFDIISAGPDGQEGTEDDVTD
jgi:general secretion pathway protein G